MEFKANQLELRNLVSLLMSIWKTPKEAENKLLELKKLLLVISNGTAQEALNIIIAAINSVLNNHTKNNSQSQTMQCLIVDIFKILFGRIKIQSLQNFFFAYHFLLNEIYDHNQTNFVGKISEEYKLSITQTTTLLMKALTWDVAKCLYTRENALSLCQMLYVVIEMAKTERFRSLRLASIECIMSFVQVDDSSDRNDMEMQNQIADILMFFAPGIISGLSEIANEDEKHGHAVAALAIRAWGRIVTLQMQNYNAADVSLKDQLFETKEFLPFPKPNWQNKNEIHDYLKSSKRTLAWYKTTDDKLQAIITKLRKLTCHSHNKVRLELTDSCLLLVDRCSITLPVTVGKVIEILIILSEDEDKEISDKCKMVLSSFSANFSSNIYKDILENLEENFYSAISSLPRVFSGLDDKEQLSGMNLLIGFLELFGKNKLGQVLHSIPHLERLIQTLIQIAELESKNISLYEEYMIQDLDLVADYRTPWKSFRYFSENSIQDKLQRVCGLLSECGVLDITADLLLDIFINSEENRKEATLLLNDVLYGITVCTNTKLTETNISDHFNLITNVINIYLDPEYWDLPLDVGRSSTLPQVQNNIVQICLQLEGLSKIALAIRSNFKHFLLKVLYPVLERAGSGYRLIKAAGTTAIINISVACGYSNVTQLINENCDYFSYNVIRKIKKPECNEKVLNVLSTVMKYSNINVLSSISDIINGVLLQTCDQFFQEHNANAYLRVFQVFVQCLTKWLNVSVKIESIKSKFQKEQEHEPFQVSNLHSDAYVDEDKDKTAEEMYKEDVENQNQEQEHEDEEYQKPQPPVHIELIVNLLKRTVNFLPSKNRNTKLLVIGILKDGLEIIREWDDELLPLVHQIWSPLVERFKEKDDSVIINYSFQLLATLSRLSKDFIRTRTANDVLPNIKRVLKDLSKTSYLQDKGSAYRYSQAYKLQLSILQHLSRVVVDLDLSDDHIISIMEALIPYFSNKQPVPLQEACMSFYAEIAKFDKTLVQNTLAGFNKREECKEEYKRNMQAVLQRICDNH